MKEKCAVVLLSIKVVPNCLNTCLITAMLFILLKRHTYYMKFSFLPFMLDCQLACYYTFYLSLKQLNLSFDTLFFKALGPENFFFSSPKVWNKGLAIQNIFDSHFLVICGHSVGNFETPDIQKYNALFSYCTQYSFHDLVPTFFFSTFVCFLLVISLFNMREVLPNVPKHNWCATMSGGVSELNVKESTIYHVRCL